MPYAVVGRVSESDGPWTTVRDNIGSESSAIMLMNDDFEQRKYKRMQVVKYKGGNFHFMTTFFGKVAEWKR